MASQAPARHRGQGGHGAGVDTSLAAELQELLQGDHWVRHKQSLANLEHHIGTSSEGQEGQTSRATQAQTKQAGVQTDPQKKDGNQNGTQGQAPAKGGTAADGRVGWAGPHSTGKDPGS